MPLMSRVTVWSNAPLHIISTTLLQREFPLVHAYLCNAVKDLGEARKKQLFKPFFFVIGNGTCDGDARGSTND